MLLNGAAIILGRVIFSTLHEGDTLRQAFYHIHRPNYHVAPNPINVMNEHDQETDGVGDLAFDHGLSE